MAKSQLVKPQMSMSMPSLGGPMEHGPERHIELIAYIFRRPIPV